MALGNLFKSLFSASSEAAGRSVSDPVDYKGFTIEASPLQEDGKFRTAGFIGGEIDGEHKRVQFIRADQHGDEQAAIDHAFSKARQIIDEQGVALLHKTQL